MTDTTWQIADDKKTVEFTMSGVVLTLTTDQVDSLLAGLGHMRSMMTPEIPKDWQSQSPCRASRNPAWTVEMVSMIEGVLFHMRDPRFGWLHYAVPAAEAKNLGSNLVRLAEKAETHVEKVQGKVN